jgi:hypothetical protein
MNGPGRRLGDDGPSQSQKQVRAEAMTSHPQIANLEMRRVVSAPAVIPARLEFCFGMNSGTAWGADGAARRRVPIT